MTRESLLDLGLFPRPTYFLFPVGLKRQLGFIYKWTTIITAKRLFCGFVLITTAYLTQGFFLFSYEPLWISSPLWNIPPGCTREEQRTDMNNVGAVMF